MRVVCDGGGRTQNYAYLGLCDVVKCDNRAKRCQRRGRHLVVGIHLTLFTEHGVGESQAVYD